ncbi:MULTISPECIES: winged helix-turn-helix transcriptional regulator [unclassified Sphingobium]|uniref:winged helix-turn-helix transcriptional regulator n=1 Tax=unclassified Sphingobium TaxID=2611147 RepID=UPI002224A785|nr:MULTISPECIES: helix-turn-helix domain-containing protein [unclassified Sphingobium]MCW2412197.1 DNA-binding HxlR family transcriptional regulator [Sphingobium sp. B8D3D]MCW2415506.1 DNA-binding HxlR family transcriptional regulator [Sphingobium sp. B8D3A]
MTTQAKRASVPASPDRYDQIDPRVEALVNDLIGQVADKWTMLLIEVLHDHGEQRFTRIFEKMPGISQKMLTQTLRQMERNGLVHRTVHPVVPPHVDYRLTEMGASLGEAFCGVWTWAEDHLQDIDAARARFDEARAR